MKRISVGAIALLYSSVITFGAEYYVSPNGSDENGGSSSSPFRTLQQAAAVVGPGDICYISEGVYRETLTPISSGTESSPITFQAAQDEQVLITGCDSVSGWSEHAPNVYVADIEDEVTQVFIDGEFAHQARFPNNTSVNPFSFESFPLTLTENSVSSASLNQEENHWQGGVVWAIVGERWIGQVADIESSEPGMLSISGNSWAENTGEGIGYITGTMAALDTAGEWHYEDGKLYLYCATGDAPENHTIDVKTRSWVMDLSNRDNIIVKDIATKGGAVNMNNSDNCILNGLTMEWLSHFVTIEQAGSSWLRHESTDISYEGIGVGIFGSNNTVKNSEIAWSAGDGVTLYGGNNRIENCVIHDCNYSGYDCNPITATGAGHVITRNTVYNGGRGLIDFLFTTDITITYNEVYNASLVNRDVGGIYTWGTNGQGSVVAYNWVHDIVSEGGYEIGMGIYIDNYCSNITVHHNVIWNCSYNAFNYSRPAKNVYWFNNTAFASQDVEYSYIPDGSPDTSAGNKMYNNLLSYTVDDFDSLEKRNNLSIDTLPLRDPADFDFRLRDDASGAIDGGIVIPGITDGYTGDAPDIGAYESGGVFWKAGAGTIDTVPAGVSENHIDRTAAAPYWFANHASVVTINILRQFTGSVRLLNAKGRVVAKPYEGVFGKGVFQLDLNSMRLSKGVYFVVVYDHKTRTVSRRHRVLHMY